MGTFPDSRQTIKREVLDQLDNNANLKLDKILDLVNDEITMPLRMRRTSNTVVTIDNIAVSTASGAFGHGRNKTIPPISNTLPAWTTGTVTISGNGATGVATPSAGSATSAFGMSANQFLKIGVHLDPTGNLVLTKGTAGASLSAATAPAVPSSTYAIGYFVISTNGSNVINNLADTAIYQYTGGGAGSGSGTGNPILETIKNTLVDSPFELATPNIIAQDGQSKIVAFGGSAAYDLVTSTIKFNANADYINSINLLDSNEFLSRGLDVGDVDLYVWWNKNYTIPTSNVTYQIGRNGVASNTVTMTRVGTTELFKGSISANTWNDAASSIVFFGASPDTSQNLAKSGNHQSLAQKFTVPSGQAWTVRQFFASMTKTGTPAGYLYVSIIKDSGGLPSTSASDILAQSNGVLANSVTAGINTLALPTTTLAAGTYHAVFTTDSAYKADGANFIGLNAQSTGSSGSETYNGTSWSVFGATTAFYMGVQGRNLDLRVLITTSTGVTFPAAIDAFAVFYNRQDYGQVGGTRKTQRFVFNSVTDNLSSFTITGFSPDPDLLMCYHVETGQVYKVPAFNLYGNVATFAANTFNNNGQSTTVTLIFDQNNGNTIDVSDVNARLLAANHLGSTSGTDDKSSAGRGIILRRPDGTLREISIDNSDNIVINTVP